ncbi:MAG TPA: hypothetical protein VGC20_01370, partial [bacterium]
MRPALLVLTVLLWAVLPAGCEKTDTASAPAGQPAGSVEWKVASSFSGTLPILGTAGPRLS